MAYNRPRYLRNREQWLAQQKRRYADDKDVRDTKLANARRWAKANPERRREIVAKWSASPAGLRSKRERESRRRARKRGVFAEPVSLVDVYERDQGRCGICGEVVDVNDWHLDHVLPLASGGTHEYDNVQVAHPNCNLRKGARASEGVVV